MISAPRDIKVLAVMQKLCGTEFTPFMKWLESEEARAKDQVIDASGDRVSRVQGEASTLRELVKLIRGSGDLLNR